MHLQSENGTEIRRQIAKEYERDLGEKESAMKNEVHRLTNECAKKEEKIQAYVKEDQAAKEQLHRLRKSTKMITAELDFTRKEKEEIGAQLRIAQQNASVPSEAANLKEDLRQKTEELQTKIRTNAALELKYANLSDKMTDLQEFNVQLETQIAQQISTIDTMRQVTNNELSVDPKRALIHSQPAQMQNFTEQREEPGLPCGLEQVRVSKTQLNDAQATQEAHDDDMLYVQTHSGKKDNKLIGRNHKVMESQSGLPKQADGTLREAGTEVHRMDEDHREKLESDGNASTIRKDLIWKQCERKPEGIKTQYHASQHGVSQPAVIGEKPLRPSQNDYPEFSRRKVNSQKGSTSSSSQQNALERTSQVAQAELLQTPEEEANFLAEFFKEAFQGTPSNEELLSNIGSPVADRAADTISQPQGLRGGLMFDEGLNQVSHRHITCHSSSSTDFTDISSETLTQMARGAQRQSTTMIRGHNSSFTGNVSPKFMSRESSTRSSSASMSRSHLSHSHEKSKSKASSASSSRRVPPQELVSHHFSQLNRPHGDAENSVIQRSSRERLGWAPSGSGGHGTSSPDFMQPQTTTIKQTYGDHDFCPHTRNEDNQLISQCLDQSRLSKRKSPLSEGEQEITVKRQRISTRTYLHHARSESKNHLLHPSKPFTISTRTKVQLSSPYRQESSPSRSHKKIQPKQSIGPSRQARQLLSSSGIHSSRSQQRSSSQARPADLTRRTSSRLTRSKSNLRLFHI